MGSTASRPDWRASWYAEAIAASRRAAEEQLRQFDPDEAPARRGPRVRARVLQLMALHTKQAADLYAAALRQAEHSPDHGDLMRLADDAIQRTVDAVMIGSIYAMVQVWLQACAEAESEGVVWERARRVFLVLCELSKGLSDAIAGSPLLHHQLPRSGPEPARVGWRTSDAFTHLCRFMDRLKEGHCRSVRSEEARLAENLRGASERADAAWQEFDYRLAARRELRVRRPGHARIHEEARQLYTAPYARA